MSEHRIIERAFDLAGSGNVRNMGEIERALSREGFLNVIEHLSAPSLLTQLKKLMAGRSANDPQDAT